MTPLPDKLKSHFLQALLFLLLYLNSRAWFTNTQFVQIPYAQEWFLGLLLAYFLFAVVPRVLWKGSIRYVELALIGLVMLITASSALAAHAYYGQPISFGLIEERRTLSYLVFFPLYDALKAGIVNVAWLLKSVFAIAVLCFVNATAYYSLVATDLGMRQAALDAFQQSESIFRADRTQIGTFYVMLALLYALWRWVENPRQWLWGIAITAFGFHLLIFEQTRQVVFAVVLASLWIIKKRKVLVLRFGAIAAVAAGTAVVVAGDYVAYLYEKYTFLFGVASNLRINLRAQTLASIFGENIWIPHGALSAMWDDGFKRFYGENFYLSDVGIFGTVFRFGVPAAIALAAGYYVYLWQKARHARKTLEVRVFKSFLFTLVILNFFIPIIETAGSEIGLALAVLSHEQLAKDDHPATGTVPLLRRGIS
jgi:hypothetical protein